MCAVSHVGIHQDCLQAAPTLVKAQEQPSAAPSIKVAHCPPDIHDRDSYLDLVNNERGNKVQLYRIEKITLQPLLVLARDHDDAANILAHAFVSGMSNRPDADFEVLSLDPDRMDRPPPTEWIEADYRGIVWSVDDDAGWELAHTKLEEP